MRAANNPAPLLHSFILFVLFAVGLWGYNDGHFYYTLDDPYIHLRLAEQIAKGNYGLNDGVFASPSSSILWPFLLAPFAYLGIATYVPLIINIICCLLTGLLATRFLAPHHPKAAPWISVLLMLVSNGYGLVFTGMEHSLQLLITAYILITLLSLNSTQPVPRLLYAALIAAPLVRYEMLGLSLGAIVYLCLHKRYSSLLCIPIIALPLAGFSYFLWVNSGYALPASVLWKQTNYSGILANSLALIIHGALLLPLLYLQRRNKSNFLWVGLIFTMVAGHQLIGRTGWMSRYEAYAVFAVWLALLRFGPSLVASLLRTSFDKAIAVLASLIITAPYWLTIISTPAVSHAVYAQQGQMGRLVKLAGYPPVAVNDIGIVSYQNPTPVLDVLGLGNVQIMQELKRKNHDFWHSQFEAAKPVLVMIYAKEDDPPVYFDPKWKKLGTLVVLPAPGLLTNPLGNDKVHFYQTEYNRFPLDTAIAAWKLGLPRYARWDDAQH